MFIGPLTRTDSLIALMREKNKAYRAYRLALPADKERAVNRLRSKNLTLLNFQSKYF